MGGISSMGPSTVKPLRRVPGDAGEKTRVSVESLKNGGTINMSAGGRPEEQNEMQTLRGRYTGRRPAPSATRGRGSQLDEAEQIGELKKIKKAANDYEAVFMDQLVKAMRQKPLEKTTGGDTFSDIAEQPFTAYLSQAGGLGLADQIVRQVSAQEGLAQTLQNHPDIMGPGWRMTVPSSQMKKSPGGLDIGRRAEGASQPQEAEIKDETPLMLEKAEEDEAPAEALFRRAPKTLEEVDEIAAEAAPRPAPIDESALTDDPDLLGEEEISYLYRYATDAG